MFEYIAGVAFIIIIISHVSLFFNVSVDRIYPECFRGCKYGGCDYYKEFYDPAYHKTKKPFEVEVDNKIDKYMHNQQRDDYNNIYFKYKYSGKSIKAPTNLSKKHIGISTTEISDSIVDSKEDIRKPSKQQYSVFQKDFDRELLPLA